MTVRHAGVAVGHIGVACAKTADSHLQPRHAAGRAVSGHTPVGSEYFPAITNALAAKLSAHFLTMHHIITPPPRRFGLRLLSGAKALLTVSALAAFSALPLSGQTGSTAALGIGVNFSAGTWPLAATDQPGLVAGANWTNVAGGTGSNIPLQDYLAAPTTARLSFRARGDYDYFNLLATPNAATNTMRRGGLFGNEGPGEISITVTGIPYATYDVYVYATGDYPADPVLSLSNGTTTYYYRGDGVTPDEGATEQTEATSTDPENPNVGRAFYMVFRNQTTSTFSLATAGSMGGVVSNNVFGFQIVGPTPGPVTPADTTAPVITAPVSIIKEATSAAGAVVTFTATAVDDIDGPVNVVASPASGSTFPLGTGSVGLAASDAAHNTATASFPVTVRDTTPPVLAGVPANLTVEATSAAGAIATFASATATDLVSAATVTTGAVSGSVFPVGTTTVTVTAKDAAGNTATKTFNVVVADTTPPVIAAQANLTAEASSAAGAIVTFAPTATDRVSATTVTTSAASGSVFPIGTATVTITAKDLVGNTAVKTFTVTVKDSTAPVLGNVTPSTATLWPPNHQMVAISINALATDAVGVASLKIVSVTSSEPDNGLGDGDTANDIQITGPLTVSLRAERSGKGNGRTYTITVEARDAAGNATTKTTTVFVPKSQNGK